MRLRVVLLIVGTFGVLGWAGGVAAGPPAALEGLLTGGGGTPVVGATVVVTHLASGVKVGAVSGPSGRYRVVGVPAGRVLVESGLARVEATAVAGQTVIVDLPTIGDRSPVGDGERIDIGGGDGAFAAQAGFRLLPLERGPEAFALLEPGISEAHPSFTNEGWDGVILYQPGERFFAARGATSAENLVTLDGLNITQPRTGIGWSWIPAVALEQVSVERAISGAESRGAGGAVLNLTTRRGGGGLHGSVDLFWYPEDLQETTPTVGGAEEVERRDSLEVNLALGGSLFDGGLGYFAFLSQQEMDWTTPNGVTRKLSDPIWGVHLDTAVAAGHRLDGTFVDNGVTVEGSGFRGFASMPAYDGAESFGGAQWVAAYTGLFGSVLVEAGTGGSESDLTKSGAGDDYPYIFAGNPSQPKGLYTNWTRSVDEDERDHQRLQLTVAAGDHSIVGGLEREDLSVLSWTEYSGGVSYRYQVDSSSPSGESVSVRHNARGGAANLENRAWYVSDRWRVGPTLTVELGMRSENFSVDNVLGESLIELEETPVPRVDLMWSPRADGRWRFRAGWGVFQQAPPGLAAVRIGGMTNSDAAVYEFLGGHESDGSPAGFTDCGFGRTCPNQGFVGELLDYQLFLDGVVADPRAVVASSVEPTTQERLVAGFDVRLDSNWTLSVTGVQQKLTQLVEGFSLIRGLASSIADCETPPTGLITSCPSAVVIGNPGEDIEGWLYLDGDGELDPVSFSAAELGYPEPERDYTAVELDLHRRFADGFMLRAHYTWSHLEGNTAGPLFPYTGDDAVWLTTAWAHPGFLDNASGDLPNDRRHRLTAYGLKAWEHGLSVAGVLHFSSGTPINSYDVHPTDPFAAQYGLMSHFDGDEPCPRGCGGTTDDVWSLDVMLGWRFGLFGLNWDARVDAFNLTDNDAEVRVVESRNDYRDRAWREPVQYQRARTVRLGLGVSF